MNIIALFKLVPDLVEELNIDQSGTALDTAWLRMIINEFDDHAIEQAILLKERLGALVTVVGLDLEGADDVLFTAAAKGADRIVKLQGDFQGQLGNHGLACAMLALLKDLHADLILTGVQAHNDLDGSLGPLLAEYLGMPYVGYVSGVDADDGKAIIKKEYPGGLVAEMEVTLPAVLGIQASEQPPRYVPVSKVRQAMKALAIEELSLPPGQLASGIAVRSMFKPEATTRAEMIEGTPDQVADRLMAVFKEAGAL